MTAFTRSLLLLTAWVAALGGCTLVNQPEPAGPVGVEAAPGGEPAAEPVTRRYDGHFTVSGASLPVELRWTEVGGEVRDARLWIPELDVEAVGDGSLREGRLRLELAYTGACDGVVRIDGSLVDGGQSVRGTLAAEDCTGEEEGGLVLRLEPR